MRFATEGRCLCLACESSCVLASLCVCVPVDGCAQVYQLADLCDMQVVYCCKTRGLGGELGNAVLSKHEILETCRIRLDGWRYHGSNMCVGLLSLPLSTA